MYAASGTEVGALLRSFSPDLPMWHLLYLSPSYFFRGRMYSQHGCSGLGKMKGQAPVPSRPSTSSPPKKMELTGKIPHCPEVGLCLELHHFPTQLVTEHHAIVVILGPNTNIETVVHLNGDLVHRY